MGILVWKEETGSEHFSNSMMGICLNTFTTAVLCLYDIYQILPTET